MHTVISFKTIFILILTSTAFGSCQKKDNTIRQKIVGSWQSTNTITELYEDGDMKESYMHTADDNNVSIMEFYADGRFTSKGRYATTEADSITVVRLEDQQGRYQITDSKLITKIDNIDAEAEMTIEFKGKNVLTIFSGPLPLPDLDELNDNKYFTSTVTYVRVN
ncbi:hypothetical protein [Olivibacter sp. XZL3]|uniref:hypothetical protein n=1 Tax=Olivibacter sp. XZL3 TaxID=1735116 RepID=UPI001066B6BB|nr:hypothetical protein [Olivibacter sp. XZL3]